MDQPNLSLTKLPVMENLYLSNSITFNKKAKIPALISYTYSSLDRYNKFQSDPKFKKRLVSDTFQLV